VIDYDAEACKNLFAEVIGQAFRDASAYNPDWKPKPKLIEQARLEQLNKMLPVQRILKSMSEAEKTAIDKANKAIRKENAINFRATNSLKAGLERQNEHQHNAESAAEFIFSDRLTRFTEHLDVSNCYIRKQFLDKYPHLCDRTNLIGGGIDV